MRKSGSDGWQGIEAGMEGGMIVAVDLDLYGARDALLWNAMKALWQGDVARAWQSCSNFVGDDLKFTGTRLLFLYQLIGELDYFSGGDEAECWFRRYMDKCNASFGVNETVLFHLGNLCARKGDSLHAMVYYHKALHIKKYYPEVYVNIALLAEQQGDSKLLQQMQLQMEDKGRMALARGEMQERRWREIPAIDPWQIPIFINARDRLGCLKQLLDWLRDAGYANIHILDNASTYPPLLEYYAKLEEQGIRVWRLGTNLGHTALWQSGILEKLDIRTPYVYTDPDVLPVENCPKDFLAVLLGLLRKYPWLEKAGLGICYEDLTYFDASAKREWEKNFYQVPVEEGVYFAPVDTTFALYRDARHYSVEAAVRTAGQLMCRHLPWYYDYEHLPEDEQYYMAHANNSSTLKEDWCKQGGSGNDE